MLIQQINSVLHHICPNFLGREYVRLRDNMAGGRKSSGKEIFFCVVLLQWFWYVGTAGKCYYQ